MANRINLRLFGFSELQHAIRRYGEELVNESVAAVRDTVETTVQEARAAAPVGVYPPNWTDRKPGHLRNSINGTIRTDGYTVTGRVRASARYAAVIELGSERVKNKRPFLIAPAIANRRALNGRLRQAVVDLAPPDLGEPRITGEGPGTPDVGIG